MSEERSTNGKEELFATFTFERLNSLQREVKQTKLYQATQAHRGEIYRQLEEALSKEMQSVLKRFVELWEEMAHYHSTYCYSRGFDDGVMFHSCILGKSKTGGFRIHKESQDEG